jgi:1,4-alpha-glucan branching enzyme
MSNYVDDDAICFFQLANKLAHEVRPGCVTIAEDVSGMPGLARPAEEGGLGFDYRLAMGLPDYWIKTIKEVQDENWNMQQIFDQLRNRRYMDKHISYAESHDQALVGDKTLAFRLMDKEMYSDMTVGYNNPVIDRGMALHKLIRLVTFTLGGEGYLNFMGNEFGHPEWIDFPREGNQDSFKYARRQWSLVDNEKLRYKQLNEFDRAMQKMDEDYSVLVDSFIELITVHEDNKVMVFRRGPMVMVFNFHKDRSLSDYRVGVPDPQNYKVILSSDEELFGGFGRVKAGQEYPLMTEGWDNRSQGVQVYLPSRTAQILKPV